MVEREQILLRKIAKLLGCKPVDISSERRLDVFKLGDVTKTPENVGIINHLRDGSIKNGNVIAELILELLEEECR